VARGTISPRGPGKWAIGVELGGSLGGKRRTWSTFEGTKYEAQVELTRLQNEVNQGTYVEPSRMTVANYLTMWLEDTAKFAVSGKTYERYAEICNLHLIPALGRHLLQKLQPIHIKAHYSATLRSGRIKPGGNGAGLSAQTVLHHHRVLSTALKAAVKLQILMRNPAEAVDPPRPERREMLALEDSQTAHLLDLLRGTHLYIPVFIAVLTGMRRGEVLALRWKDVDLKGSTATVRQSIEDTREGIKFKQPKTRQSRRSVTLSEILVDALTFHREQQRQDRARLGTAYQDNGLVCAREDGRPFDPSEQITRAFAKFIRKTDLPQIRFHDLRHTHATNLMKAGTHPLVVSKRLGHSTIGITMDTYSHVTPVMQEDAAQRIDAMMRAAMDQHKKPPH
jgi:integrase